MPYTIMGLERPLELVDIADAAGLDRCIRCNRCTKACPSAARGGVDPQLIVEQTLDGTVSLGKDSKIWECAMCNMCSHVCPVRVNPSYLMTLLRNASAEQGNAPKRYVQASDLMLSTGLSFPSTRLTERMRSKLDLGPVRVTKRALDDLESIKRTTGADRLE